MTRLSFCERILRQHYNGQPYDDATITTNLVNQYVNDGIALAAKNNYKENYQLDGVGYVNNSFYCTFKGLSVTSDEDFLYKFTLPQIPLGLGATDGLSRVVFKDIKNKVSYPAIMLNENQVSIQRSMRSIPNKICCYTEGIFCYALTTILLDKYTASVTLISGGDSTDLNSILNIPDDSVGSVIEYVKAQLSFERNIPVNSVNDGMDARQLI